jgi:hypothetical protein
MDKQRKHQQQHYGIDSFHTAFIVFITKLMPHNNPMQEKKGFSILFWEKCAYFAHTLKLFVRTPCQHNQMHIQSINAT